MTHPGSYRLHWELSRNRVKTVMSKLLTKKVSNSNYKSRGKISEKTKI